MINPFQSPTADLDDREPDPASGKADDGLSDPQRRRRRGLPRETTLKALGIMKVASGLFFCLGWLALPLTAHFRPQALPAELRFGNPTMLTLVVVISALAGLAHLAIAGALMQLRRWACWAQGASSATGCLAALALMAESDRQASSTMTLFSGMLLLSMEAVCVYLVLSQPSARVTSASYHKVIEATPDWHIGKIIAFKAGLLATLWIADLAAVILALYTTLA